MQYSYHWFKGMGCFLKNTNSQIHFFFIKKAVICELLQFISTGFAGGS